MECSQVRKILFEYADLDFPADLGGKIESHLAGCQGCSAQFRALQDQMLALKSLPRLKAPISVLDSVREQVETGGPVQRALGYLSSVFDSGQFMKLAGAATAAVLVIASLYSITGQPGHRASVSTVIPPAAAPSVPSAPGGAGGAAERFSAKSAAPAPASQPAPTVVRRETITLALRQPESLNIRTRSNDAAERAAVKGESAQPRMKTADKMASMGLGGLEKEPSSGMGDAVLEAKRAVVLSGGKIIDRTVAGHPQELEAEIPSENYAALLERLRSLGDISDEKAGADFSTPGSTVHLTLKFSMKD